MNARRVRLALAPLEEREFRVLFTGRLVSMLGSAVAPIGLAFAVLQLGGSATDLGIVLAASMAPQLVFLLIGGIWADRLPRNLVLVWTNVLNAGAQLAAAAVLLSGVGELWHLIVLSVVRGIAMAFFFPASQGLVPQTVSATRLQHANALLQLSVSVTNIGGAALGGLLVSATSPGAALGLDGLSYLASAVILARMRLPRSERLAASSFLTDLAEGWREFRSRTWLWVNVSQHAVQNAFVLGTIFILGPVIADRFLSGARDWGFIVAANFVGFLVGGVIAARFRPQRPLLWSALAFIPLIPALIVLGSVHEVVAICTAAASSGIGIAVSGVLWETTVMQRVPPEKLSRVVSYDALGSFAAIPIGYTLIGPVSDALGLEATCWLAAGILLVSIVVQVSVRDIRELRAVDADAVARRAAPTPPATAG